MFTGLLTSRVRVFIVSGVSVLVSDLASAKLSTMLANAKIASMQATKVAATKVMAKLAALWMLVMSCFVPIHNTLPVVQKQSTHRHAHVAKSVTSPVAPNQEEEVVEKPLYLHTLEKEYTAVFAGKVTCGDALCHSSSLLIHLVSKKNPNIVKTIIPQPDGSYEVSFVLKEYLNEHLDWWITANSPDSASQQIQGREILSEESSVSIEQTIALL